MSARIEYVGQNPRSVLSTLCKANIPPNLNHTHNPTCPHTLSNWYLNPLPPTQLPHLHQLQFQIHSKISTFKIQIRQTPFMLCQPAPGVPKKELPAAMVLKSWAFYKHSSCSIWTTSTHSGLSNNWEIGYKLFYWDANWNWIIIL